MAITWLPVNFELAYRMGIYRLSLYVLYSGSEPPTRLLHRISDTGMRVSVTVMEGGKSLRVRKSHGTNA